MTQTDDRAGQVHVDGNPQFRALMGLGISIAELEVLRRSGYIERDRRRNNQAYWRLRFRHCRRNRTVYIGNDLPVLEQVRLELRTLQIRRRQNRELAHAVHLAKRALSSAKAQLAPQLAGIGYRFHGHVIRKRRNGPETQTDSPNL